MLILCRALFGWRDRARRAERARLVPLLLVDAPEEEVRPDLWLAADFTADLMVELIHMVRGQERERFIARAQALGVPERLRHHLGNASPRIRQAAAEALGLFDDSRSLARLTAALDDPNPDVRLTAALALAQAGHAPPVRDLVRRLDIGRAEKSLLVTALFKELARHSPQELEAALSSPGAPELARIAAAEALADAGRYAAVPLIVAAAEDEAEDGRALPRYLAALSALRHPAAAPAVERALASPMPLVRAAAAEAAGKIGLAELSGRLRDLLSDPNWQVRFRAGEALAALGGPGVECLKAAAAEAGAAGTAAARILAERALA